RARRHFVGHGAGACVDKILSLPSGTVVAGAPRSSGEGPLTPWRASALVPVALGHALDLPVLTGGGSRLATTRRCCLRSPLRTGSGTLRLPTLGLDHDIGHRCVLGTIAVHELPDHIRDDLVHLALDLVRVAL